MSRVLMLARVGTILLADGYLCGHWDGRWSNNQEAAAAKLQNLPLTIGDWQGEAQQLNPKVAERAGFGGYLLRRYENKRTGATVVVLLASGRPGTLAVHTPEVCYAGAGFTMAKAATRERLERTDSVSPAECFETKFVRKDALVTEELRVVWTWNKNGTWQCPDNPRWSLTGVPVVYKLYITQTLVPGGDDTNVCLEFLRDALPELDRVVVQDR
jgi:hypothetical protein